MPVYEVRPFEKVEIPWKTNSVWEAENMQTSGIKGKTEKNSIGAIAFLFWVDMRLFIWQIENRMCNVSGGKQNFG